MFKLDSTVLNYQLKPEDLNDDVDFAEGELSAANILFEFECSSSPQDSAAFSSYTSLQILGDAMRVKLSSVITEVLNTQ